MPFSAVFITGRPQAKTNTVRISQGIHARSTAPGGCLVKVFMPGATVAPDPPDGVPRVDAADAASEAIGAPAPASAGPPAVASPPGQLGSGAAACSARWFFSEVDVQIVFGFQTRRNAIRQTMELIAAMTSTSSGPM